MFGADQWSRAENGPGRPWAGPGLTITILLTGRAESHQVRGGTPRRERAYVRRGEAEQLDEPPHRQVVHEVGHRRAGAGQRVGMDDQADPVGRVGAGPPPDTGRGKIRLDDLILRIPASGIQKQAVAVGIVGGDREKR